VGGAVRAVLLFGRDQATGVAVEELDTDVLFKRALMAADG